MLHVPVTYIVYNRPDAVRESFATIREAHPERLYLVSDAAREGDEDTAKKVAACRDYVESHLDWPCQLERVYAEHNMGCRDRVSSGITEVLSKEPYTIILEDDIVPVPDFFPYCETLLKRYLDEPRVMMVSGCNLLREAPLERAYGFSCFSSIWGWATWARAWKEYDVDVADWRAVDAAGTLRGVTGRGLPYQVLRREIESVYTKKKDTWDIQWDYCRHTHRGLGVVPRENLIRNIGFGADATHTTWSATQDFSCGGVEFPIEDVPIRRDLDYDRAYVRAHYGSGRLREYVKKRVRTALDGISGRADRKAAE